MKTPNENALGWAEIGRDLIAGGHEDERYFRRALHDAANARGKEFAPEVLSLVIEIAKWVATSPSPLATYREAIAIIRQRRLG